VIDFALYFIYIYIYLYFVYCIFESLTSILGALLPINVPWSQEYSDFLKFWSWASCLWVSVLLRLLHPYSTEDKPPRLMVKQFSTARNTQRDSQSYIEKRGGKREIEVTRKRKGRVKRGESNQDSNQIPKWKWILKISFLKVHNW